MLDGNEAVGYMKRLPSSDGEHQDSNQTQTRYQLDEQPETGQQDTTPHGQSPYSSYHIDPRSVLFFLRRSAGLLLNVLSSKRSSVACVSLAAKGQSTSLSFILFVSAKGKSQFKPSCST